MLRAEVFNQSIGLILKETNALYMRIKTALLPGIELQELCNSVTESVLIFLPCVNIFTCVAFLHKLKAHLGKVDLRKLTNFAFFLGTLGYLVRLSRMSFSLASPVAVFSKTL